MVLKLPYYFFKSLKILRSDRKILLFSTIPVLIGMICYYFLGQYVYSDLYEMGKEYIKLNFQFNSWVEPVLMGIITLLFLVLINWTFFVFVSIIASPINDHISKLVEQKYLPATNSEQSDFNFSKVFEILKNEFKKVFFVLFLSFINIVIGLFFPPVSFILAALILAISFIDYSWSRNELIFGDCFKNLRVNVLTYTLGGALFMFLISIPILNLFFLPLAVIFFTVLYCEIRNKDA